MEILKLQLGKKLRIFFQSCLIVAVLFSHDYDFDHATFSSTPSSSWPIFLTPSLIWFQFPDEETPLYSYSYLNILHTIIHNLGVFKRNRRLVVELRKLGVVALGSSRGWWLDSKPHSISFVYLTVSFFFFFSFIFCLLIIFTAQNSI